MGTLSGGPTRALSGGPPRALSGVRLTASRRRSEAFAFGAEDLADGAVVDEAASSS
jgi:hypothetical protein